MTKGSAMLTAEADIRTEHAARYLARLCGHAGKVGTAGHRMGHGRPSHARGDAPSEVRRVECSGTEEAADQESLRRIRDLLTARLQTFGRHEHLIVKWQDLGG
jgi:hypothetical protein